VAASIRGARAWPEILARLLGVIGLGIVVVSLVVWASRGFDRLPTSLAQIPVLPAVVFVAVGALLATRSWRHPIGWLFLGVGLIFCVILPLELLVGQAYEAFRPAPPMTLFLAWLVSSFATPLMVGLLGLAGLVFPDGHLISPRWRLAAAAAILAVVGLGLSVGLDPSGLLWYPTLPNPFAAPPELVPLLGALRVASLSLLLVAIGCVVAASLIRYGSGDAITRAKLRWVLYAALLQSLLLGPFVVARYVLSLGPAPTEVAVLLTQLSWVLLPLAAAFAITRHRLFGIDVLIGRTLVYVPLVGALGGLYALAVAAFQRVFLALTGETSDAALLVSLFLIAAAVTPLRKALEGAVDSWARQGAPADPARADLRGPAMDPDEPDAVPLALAAPLDPEIGKVAASILALRRLEARMVDTPPTSEAAWSEVDVPVDASGHAACPRGEPVALADCLGCAHLAGLTTSPPTIRCRLPVPP